jgi:hypothetical protein
MVRRTFCLRQAFFRKSHLVTVPMESSIGFRNFGQRNLPVRTQGFMTRATKSWTLRYFSGNTLIARKALPSQTQP